MSFTPSSPVTGSAIAVFTSPTYTFIADTPPSVNSKQYAVTALGGTQANVDVHSVSKPFTFTMFRPQSVRTLPQASGVTGIIKNIPNNIYKLVTRKGAVPSVNQMALVPRVTTTIEVPAGTDTYEPEELKAMLSLHFGILSQQSSGIADLICTGVL